MIAYLCTVCIYSNFIFCTSSLRMIFIWRQKKKQNNTKKEITMRWWWCIMYTFFILMYESPFLFVRQQEKLSVKFFCLFLWGVCPTQKSGGLQGWPRKPVRTEEPVIRVCLYSNAYKYKYSISIFSYILTFKYMSSLSPPHSPNYDPECSPCPTYPIPSYPCFSQNIFLFYSIYLARRTAN